MDGSATDPEEVAHAGADDPDSVEGPGGHAWVLKALVVGLVVVAAGYFALRPASDDRVDTLPSFELSYLDGGGTLTSESLQGKPVVVNFWASWCGPCRTESPLLETMHRRYRDQGLVIVGVDVEDVPAAAREFVEEFGLTYAIVEDLDKKLYSALRLQEGLPQTYFVEPDGTVVMDGPARPALGELDEADLEAAIAYLLDAAR